MKKFTDLLSDAAAGAFSPPDSPEHLRVLASALREDAARIRKEMQWVAEDYLRRIDWLSAEAAKLEAHARYLDK